MKPSAEQIQSWEKEYLDANRGTLSKRQVEILEGAELKSHEGMMYGSMYRAWKEGVLEE